MVPVPDLDGKRRKISGLSTLTIGELLKENASRYGKRDAVVYIDKNVRLTWRELNRICDQAAKGFMALGVKRRDHIAVWGTNRPFWLITQFAAAKNRRGRGHH